jgi:hypothetical protein
MGEEHRVTQRSTEEHREKKKRRREAAERDNWLSVFSMKLCAPLCNSVFLSAPL